MSKVKVFIVEDDFLHLTQLTMFIEELGLDLAGSSPKAENALNMILAVQPDLLLVDIQLKGSLNGIQLVENLNQHHPIPVIFLTAFRDEATINKAKNTDPYAYIIKPYDKNGLKAAIELAIHKFSKTTDFIEFGKGKEYAFNENEDLLIKDNLFVKKDGNLIKIKLVDIQYIEVKGRICILGAENEVFELRMTLQKIEEKLPKKLFLRVHRSFIINQEEIIKVNLTTNEITVANHLIPLGRSYREAFLNNLDTFHD